MSKAITRRLKKESYKILEKYHDLESERSRARVVKYQDSNKPLLLSILDYLDTALTQCLEPLNDGGAETFLKAFRSYSQFVKSHCIDESHTLRRARLAKLQKMHTSLFNRLLGMETELEPGCMNAAGDDCLSQATWAAVIIWGNNL